MTVSEKSELEISSLPGINGIIYARRVTSTQDAAREIMTDSGIENCLVLAEEQTDGKGRMGRVWASSPGGLYMTLIIRPKVECRFVKGLGIFAAEIIKETLEMHYGIRARIKQPNDVYAYDRGRKKYRKIAGILTSSATINKDANWVLLGMGVNINNEIPSDIREKAVSLKNLKRRKQDRVLFLKRFFSLFWERYSHWQAGSEVKSVR